MGKVPDADALLVVSRLSSFCSRCLPAPHVITLRLEIRRAHVLRVESGGTVLIWGSLRGGLGRTVVAHEMSCSASLATHRV